MQKRGLFTSLALVAFLVGPSFANAPGVSLDKPAPAPVIAPVIAVAPPLAVVPEPDPAELRCLALNIYWEARGESLLGQKAVAHVTLNRVADPDYPKTVCDVVQQGGRVGPCQFHWYCDLNADEPKDRGAFARARRIAKQAMIAPENDPTDGALLFHHKSRNPDWSQAKGAQRRQIGAHVFVRPARKAGSEIAKD